VALNALNKVLHERLAARTDILLTQTELDGIFCLRFAVGSLRTDVEHVQKAFEIVTAEATVVLSGV
jgi:aromatic-L-amino-acid/L-tryptophan decarboxylase